MTDEPSPTWSDDELLVWADKLQQQGDPRGEFIAIQIARARGTAVEGQRDSWLANKYGDAWIGKLAKCLYPIHRTWERGWLAKAVLRTKAKDALKRARGDLAWRSVHTVMFSDDSFAPPVAELAPFLADPVMANVRRLDWIKPALVDALLAASPVPRYERILVTTAPTRWAAYGPLCMTELGVMDPTPVSLTDLPITVKAFYARGDALAPWLARFAKAPRPLVRFELVSPLDLVDEPISEFRFVVDRKANTLHITARGKSVAKALAGLKPTTFKAITVDGALSPQLTKLGAVHVKPRPGRST